MSVSTEGKRKEGGLAEGGRVVLHALLIALVIQTLLLRSVRWSRLFTIVR
jgi:hypothetical protein